MPPSKISHGDFALAEFKRLEDEGLLDDEGKKNYVTYKALHAAAAPSTPSTAAPLVALIDPILAIIEAYLRANGKASPDYSDFDEARAVLQPAAWIGFIVTNDWNYDHYMGAKGLRAPMFTQAVAVLRKEATDHNLTFTGANEALFFVHYDAVMKIYDTHAQKAAGALFTEQEAAALWTSIQPAVRCAEQFCRPLLSSLFGKVLTAEAAKIYELRQEARRVLPAGADLDAALSVATRRVGAGHEIHPFVTAQENHQNAQLRIGGSRGGGFGSTNAGNGRGGSKAGGGRGKGSRGSGRGGAGP